MLSFIYVIFIFIWQILLHPSIIERIKEKFPWQLIALMLNFHLRYSKDQLEFAPTCTIRPRSHWPKQGMPQILHSVKLITNLNLIN